MTKSDRNGRRRTVSSNLFLTLLATLFALAATLDATAQNARTPIRLKSGRGVVAVAAGQTPRAVSSVQGTGVAAAVANKEATVFGQKIHYVEAGSGPVVVLLHGLGGSSANWAFNTPALAAKYRVIVPDQIGFGRSDKPPINYRIGTYVDFLDKFLAELNIEKASLVGNSMGGWIAVSYALAHPSKVERLVLADAAGFAPPKDLDLATLSGLNPSTREGMRQLANRVFFNKQLFTSDAAIDAMLTQRLTAGDGHTIQSLVESVARREDMLDGRLAAIKHPTLIIWGREDGLTTLAYEGERYRRELPAAQFVIFEQCGHVPQVEKAADFNAAVLKFLAASS